MGHLPDDDGREVFGEVFSEPLDGGDFILRHVREEDVAHIVALVDDHLRSGLLLHEDFDEETARPFLLHGGAFVIADADTDLPLGGMRLFLHGDAVEFGYWLGAPARGRGLAGRALALFSSEVVSRLEVSRLELRTTEGNTASEAVARRGGFELVGPEPPLEYPGGRVIETNLWVRGVEPV